MNTFIKDTSLGQIKGLKMDDGTVQYRGVRYANADRWTYPVGSCKWDGVYDATEYGAACVQLRSFSPEGEKNPLPFYYKEFREGIEFKYSEDCFFLDIYAPENAQNADVIIYIHGGAFLGGCGCELHMDGTAYAKKNIIFVSINYRLGILGFLADRKLAEESGHSGNYGLYDQLEAIKWVHEHIADFGGNPDNITLFGQSAGAMSVQQHCLSPLTKPYFKKVYMASGGGIGKDFAYVGPVEDSYDYWARLTDLLGDGPKQWREQPVDKLFDAFGQIADQDLMQHCCPHIDGLLIEKSPEKSAHNLEFAKVPYILSTNSQDMVPESLHAMSKEWCKLVNDNGGNAYYFYFSRQLPGDEAGAFHSAELWYTIGSLHKCWRPFTDYDSEISESLVDAIASFAKDGNPCCDKIPDWKPFESESDTLIISDSAIGSRLY
jgi:para-nitrobenzyl esterase